MTAALRMIALAGLMAVGLADAAGAQSAGPAAAPPPVVIPPPPAAVTPPLARSRLDRIAARGVLRAGTRGTSPPFASRRGDGRFYGFSVDMLERIRASIARRIGVADLRLELVEVTSSDRLDRVRSGDVDLVCGLTTPTWSREETVDFSLPFFVDGTRILTYRDIARRGIEGLRGRRIAVLERSTTAEIIAMELPFAELVLVKDMGTAMSMLEAREVEAVSNIGTFLEGLRARSNQRVALDLLPADGFLHQEAMACVLPEGDSDLRDAVNSAIADMLEGIEVLTGDYIDLYYTWFGVNGTIYYPLDADSAAALAAGRIWLR